MRCLTCGDTAHPGYVAHRETDIGGRLVQRSLVPCADCGGSALAGGADGAAISGREVIESADQVVETADAEDGSSS
jgi:hypothetical protein